MESEEELESHNKRVHDLIDQGDPVALEECLRGDAENSRRVDGRGWTPLMRAVAAVERKLEIVELLLTHGARVNATDSEGRGPLHVLCVGTGEQCSGPWPGRFVNRLVNAGADLEAVTSWGWTPLAAAMVEEDEEHVRALLSAGANPNVRFSPRAFPAFTRGWTLGHYCTVQTDGARFLKLLLDAKLDLSWRNTDGDTVLDLCEQTLEEPEEDMDEALLRNVEECAKLLQAR